MPQYYLEKDVFTAAVDRMTELYAAGHRIVVAFSAGKDSGVCLEICLIAARATGRLPVEVVMRDEEIMYPGTYEYAERTAARPEVKFYWLIANQPIINVFDRKQPYWWVFDPLLEPEQWVRQPPPYAQHIPELNIQAITAAWRFPPPEGKDLFCVMGLRTQESINRRRGLFSSGGYLTGRREFGERCARPIYDWTDGDIWKAVHDNHWDYNSAYDVMHRLGVPRSKLRIAPPTMNSAGFEALALSAKAWPQWFDRVSIRLPGVRTAAYYGKRAVLADRRLEETWEMAYQRLCIDEAPQWIAERARICREIVVERHKRHSSMPFPDMGKCAKCGQTCSWQMITRIMYSGDPFLGRLGSEGEFEMKIGIIEPEFFRPGSGKWGGKPSF